MSKIRSDNFKGIRNPNYKDISEFDLYNEIINNNNEIAAKNLNISKHTLIEKCKKYFNLKPKELREQYKNNSEDVKISV